MEQPSDRVRTGDTYHLPPTPAHEQALEAVVSRWRRRYTCALEHRTTWWGRGQGISPTSCQQATELPELKAACPQYAEVHAQVVQAGLRRVDTP